MMDRAEKLGLAAALIGHAVLFGLLSVGFLATPDPQALQPTPIEVSLVEEVGLEAQAPASIEPPAPSIAPETGPPEDAAPPAPEAAPPEPAPEPEPAPPAPAPEPAPAARPAPKARPRPERPKPAERPPEKKAAERPAPKAPPKAAPKRDTPPAKKAPPKAAAAKGSGNDSASTKARPRGSRLGDDFLKGLSDTPSESKAVTPPSAARVDARALAGIRDAIRRQIQPCADKQVNPGPGANAIVTVLNLRLNRDGTLAGNPRQVRQTGVTGENERYAQRVTDLGIAAFRACSPLKLPAEYYSTANGGWSNINYNWQLR
ncbi:cell envelope biogenesis protein TolA [Sphingomonas baiyangensis]|uniref:Cell envelope biogenesis protein TolA n=1 Tax=Sphingomonas baiyangensis TaxID=2572576 RepID=A0A4U1L5Z0_9SPHN|nr:cell envelope biogenesis protein TolA [Sphingomonas baiyangensis]TKD51690.1 cell envelope biogenesis protein TolA [Sphingomonas baiyangensis]